MSVRGESRAVSGFVRGGVEVLGCVRGLGCVLGRVVPVLVAVGGVSEVVVVACGSARVRSGGNIEREKSKIHATSAKR